MPVKRSRIGRSSSFGDSPDRLCSPRTASPAPDAFSASNPDGDSSAKKALKQSPPARILTVSSPVPAMEKASFALTTTTDAFFERCYLCKKKIDQGKDVFMYSYLRAFCSPECRNEQIFMDTKMEIMSEVLTESMAAEPGRMNDGKNPFGLQVDKHAAPLFQIN